MLQYEKGYKQGAMVGSKVRGTLTKLCVKHEARIKELEDALGAIYEVFPRGVQDRFVDDLMKNVSNYEFGRLRE
jgi:hypothetical protein